MNSTVSTVSACWLGKSMPTSAFYGAVYIRVRSFLTLLTHMLTIYGESSDYRLIPTLQPAAGTGDIQVGPKYNGAKPITTPRRVDYDVWFWRLRQTH